MKNLMRATHALLALTFLWPRATPAEPRIIDRPIQFGEERQDLTRSYIKKHYGLSVQTIEIVPRAIVIHWTATQTLRATWNGLNRVRMRAARKYLLRGGAVNVSAHFLVDRGGEIYRLMPETWMARHCIGLNYDSIGIENVGGGPRWPLTAAQRRANAELVRYLARKYKTIRYLLGHFEWKQFEAAPFFRELDPTYRNAKDDPGPAFMTALRLQVSELRLLDRYRRRPAPPKGSPQ
jgi:N-acetyl-anhydromuramyl-L-alanine amidase AmpD